LINFITKILLIRLYNIIDESAQQQKEIKHKITLIIDQSQEKEYTWIIRYSWEVISKIKFTATKQMEYYYIAKWY